MADSLSNHQWTIYKNWFYTSYKENVNKFPKVESMKLPSGPLFQQ